MIKVEGYKMITGAMLITPKCKDISPMRIMGDWLYKPDTKCWYSQGHSFAEEICEVLEDETR